MKKYLFVLSLFLIFVGCEDKYESVPLYKPIYGTTTYKIHDNNSLYPVYTIQAVGGDLKVYNKDLIFSSKLVYTIKAEGDDFKVYNKDLIFSSELVYTIKAEGKDFKVYNKDLIFSSELVYTIKAQ